MRIKNDDVLAHLRSFGFTMEENHAQAVSYRLMTLPTCYSV